MSENAPTPERPVKLCIWPGCRSDISILAPNTSYCFDHKRSRASRVTTLYRHRKRLAFPRVALELK